MLLRYIGANDLMQAVGLGEILASKQPIVPTEEMINMVNTAATQLSVNLQESIKLIRTKTDAPIMLYSIYNPFGQSTDPFTASLYNIAELITTKVNTEIISQIAAHTGSIYLDAYSVFTGNQVNYIIQGDIHPTKAGHEALALLATKELPSLQPLKEMTIDEPILSTKEDTSRPVLVILPKNMDIVEFKWLPGAKNIADFATAGTKVTGNSFEIAENGIYTIYAKTATGSEAVRSFEIKID